MKLLKFLLCINLLFSGLIFSAEINHNINKQLLDAIETNQIEQVKKLLDAGASLTTRTKHGCTPLIEACVYNNTEIAKLILGKSNKDIVNLTDNNGRNALFAASWHNNVEMMRLLIEAGANYKIVDLMHFNILDLAGGLESIKYLLAHCGFTTDQKIRKVGKRKYQLSSFVITFEYVCDGFKSLNVIDDFVNAGFDINEIYEGKSFLEKIFEHNIADKKLMFEIVNKLIQNKVLLNVKTKSKIGTFLGLAASAGYPDIVELLLKNGANHRVILTYPSGFGGRQKFPIEYALQKCDLAVVDAFMRNEKYTIDEIIDCFSMKDNNSSLSKYILSDNPDLFLKEMSSSKITKDNVNYKDKFCKRTPLMWAIVLNNNKIVQALLETNLVKFNLKDCKKMAALDLAKKYNSIDAVRMLYKHYFKKCLLKKRPNFTNVASIVFDYCDEQLDKI